MRQIWNKIVAWVLSVPTDKRLHFVCGLIIAAFFAIALDMKFCFWPVIFFAAGKEVFSREPGLSERLRAPGAGESFGAPLSRFWVESWKI